MRSFGVFFDLGLNERLSKHCWGWWLETLLHPLWRHFTVFHLQHYDEADQAASCSHKEYDASMENGERSFVDLVTSHAAAQWRHVHHNTHQGEHRGCKIKRMGLLPDSKNCGLHMHRECRERFPCHCGLAIPTCITARAGCTPESLTSAFLWSRWRGKRSRHSRRMRNPQFDVSGEGPMW